MSEPIHILCLGGGVQSSTLALRAAHNQIEPMPLAAVFADTQDEPDSVYKWMDQLEHWLPYPVYRVSRGHLSETVVKLHEKIDGKTTSRSGIPYFTLSPSGEIGMSIRQCTEDFKIHPIHKKVKEIAGKEKVILWFGISLDEVTRMKMSRQKQFIHRWPLIEARMSRHDCLRWMESNGYPTPPRSACVFCPFHSDTEWRRLRDVEPKSFARAVRFEKALQTSRAKVTSAKSIPFLHRSCKPLDEVDFSTDVDNGQGLLWQNECSGGCGV